MIHIAISAIAGIFFVALIWQRVLANRAWQQVEDLRDHIYTQNTEIALLQQRAAQAEKWQAEHAHAQHDNKMLTTENQVLKHKLEAEQKAIKEQQAFIVKLQEDMAHRFKSLSRDVLEQNSKSFLELANTNLTKWQTEAQKDLTHRHSTINETLKPVRDALKDVDTKLASLEKQREGAYEGIKEQIKHLQQTHKDLRAETTNLAKALKNPNARGRWGEIQLRRVVELAGMLPHCDFYEQNTYAKDDSTIRPDMVIQLPGGKKIVLDAKTPLHAYMQAAETQVDEDRERFLRDHAKQVRQHIKSLGSKNYLDHLPIDGAPEFVVLFLPGDPYFSAALEYDPTLIEYGVDARVILATPTTLIALLRSIAFGWQQEALARNIRHIAGLGKEIYKRLSDLTTRFGTLGKNISSVVDSYNQTVGTLERRVLSSARKFNQLNGDDQAEPLAIEPLDKNVRAVVAPELITQTQDKKDLA